MTVARGLLLVVFVACAGCAAARTQWTRLYELMDMNDLVRWSFSQKQHSSNPGLVCGVPEGANSTACFKLLVERHANGATSLVYDSDLTDKDWIMIYQFPEPVKDVYLIQANQPDRGLAVKLVTFEKSAVVFSWKDGQLLSEWVAD